MAKTPGSGKAKTRITSLAPAQVLELYRCFLQDTLALAMLVEGVEPVVAYTPPEAEREMRTIVPSGFSVVPQEGADLNERMENAFRRRFQLGYGAVVMMGSDSPNLPPTYVTRALRALEDPQVDVVLGPCDDGGYYLIGLKSLHPELFRQVKMSTPSVMDDTLQLAKAANLRVALLPPWYDVDTGEDLRRLHALLLKGDGAVAEHTRRFLLSVWPL